MSNIVTTYLIYTAMSLGLTVWVAHTLFVNGRAFLMDVFRGNAALADSVNKLLVVGFYLINLGFVTLHLRIADPSRLSARTAVELLSTKIGVVLLVLGVMHFGNLLIFSRWRRHVLDEAYAPVDPDGFLPAGDDPLCPAPA